MKKAFIAVTIILLITGTLFASPSWIGAQGVVSNQKNTTTVGAIKQETSTNLAGLNIAGTIYPGDSPLGIGFQVGAAKIFKATNNDTEVEWSDYPPTWNIGAMAKFNIGMSEMLALELGAGLMYERTINTYYILGYEAETTLNTLCVLTAADLLVHLSDSFALVGGIGVSIPLTTKGTYNDNLGISTEETFDVKGYTVSGKLGVAFGF
ncbi:MAG TPA: hypothetical protein VJ869_15715 [Sphaerochaeta sp.]|nr:hypothetical protein [Sphaerochaeta sp.]